MILDTLHTPFEIVLKDVLAECPRPVHRHSFFELVYIVSGSGQQCINQSTFAYRPGHLFLLPPDDTHSFRIAEPTQFLFIRFNHVFLQASPTHSEAIHQLAYLLQQVNHTPGCVLHHPPDRILLHPLMAAIMQELGKRDLYHQDLMHQLVKTLLVLVARNIALVLPRQLQESTQLKVLGIAQYLQANIYCPQKLKAAHVSKQFGVSEAYLGRYFKQHTGETMQQYVTHYKLQLIEHRLLHSHLRISEIADELGFTDKSHLGRIFKKYYGMNPAEYRRSAGAPASLVVSGTDQTSRTCSLA